MINAQLLGGKVLALRHCLKVKSRTGEDDLIVPTEGRKESKGRIQVTSMYHLGH